MLEPLVLGTRFHEVLQLHLLELTRAEDEVARRDLVAERLADLRDAERQLLAAHLLHDREVHELALRRLRRQVHDAGLVGHRPHVRLEHQVELLGLGELRATAVGARDDAVGVGLKVVVTEPLVAVRAFDQWIAEPRDVATGLPDLRRHEQRRFQAHDLVAELDHGSPPRGADIAAQLHPQRTVVPRRAQPAVDLRGLERDPPTLREGGDGLHEVGGHDAMTPLPAAGSDRWREDHGIGRVVDDYSSARAPNRLVRFW